ncbi:MAG: acyl carrier protein [Frankiales bacterium]|nr:acyl carrier protein [Frankiales bacterium]
MSLSYKENSVTTTASYPDLLTGLTEIVDEICGSATAEKVTIDATFDGELQIDSLTMVEIVVACEERFGVRIPDEALEQLKTVGDAVQFIANAGVAA